MATLGFYIRLWAFVEKADVGSRKAKTTEVEVRSARPVESFDQAYAEVIEKMKGRVGDGANITRMDAVISVNPIQSGWWKERDVDCSVEAVETLRTRLVRDYPNIDVNVGL